MNNNTQNIVVSSLGALTPVGLNVEQSCAAIKAGISQITEHAYFECTPDDPEWDEDLPLFSSTVPIIDPYLDGSERLTELSIPPLTEVIEKSNLNRKDLNNTGLLLSLPDSSTATKSIGDPSVFIQQLCKRTGLARLKIKDIIQTGHVGVFQQIEKAVSLLASGELEYCLVGGVDSYLLEQRLELFDSNWRIKSERNVDGFIPGEAAVMLLLETEAHAKSRKVQPLSKITAIATEHESQTIHSKQNSTGLGLTQAISAVHQNKSDPSGYQSVYCSLNGESYYAFEWGIQLTRLSPIFENMKELHHPAENCGDIGAATGGLLLACATMAFQKEDDSTNDMLLWASSDQGQRVALNLEICR